MLRRALILSLVLLFALSSMASAKAPTKWRYTAVGSSNASGLYSKDSYNELFRAIVEQDTGVKVDFHNRAVPGWTSQEVLNEITKNPARQAEFAASDIIIWDAGYNEIGYATRQFIAGNGDCGGENGLACYEEAFATIMANADRIAAELQRLRAGKPTLNVLVTNWNQLPTDNPLFAMNEMGMNLMVDHFRASAEIYGYQVLDIRDIVNGPNHDQAVPAEYLAKDGQHLSLNAHAKIAEALQAMGYGPLR